MLFKKLANEINPVNPSRVSIKFRQQGNNFAVAVGAGSPEDTEYYLEHDEYGPLETCRIGPTFANKLELRTLSAENTEGQGLRSFEQAEEVLNEAKAPWGLNEALK